MRFEHVALAQNLQLVERDRFDIGFNLMFVTRIFLTGNLCRQFQAGFRGHDICNVELRQQEAVGVEQKYDFRKPVIEQHIIVFARDFDIDGLRGFDDINVDENRGERKRGGFKQGFARRRPCAETHVGWMVQNLKPLYKRVRHQNPSVARTSTFYPIGNRSGQVTTLCQARRAHTRRPQLFYTHFRGYGTADLRPHGFWLGLNCEAHESFRRPPLTNRVSMASSPGPAVGGFTMLRNSPDFNEVINRQKFPKNNYFCYRWRILDHFSSSIERQKFHLTVQGADNHRSLLSDKVLQLYKARYHGNRQDLIVDLARDAKKFLDRRRNENSKLSKVEVILSKAMRDLMNRAFNTLLAFSTELNSLLGLSELFIAVTEPEVKKRSNKHETSIAVYVQAHLSTSLFRLVLDGRQDTMSFYIIPSDNILALGELAERYNPVRQWHAKFDEQGRVYWMSDSGILTEEMLEVACAELLRALLSTTQEALAPHGDEREERNANYDLLEKDPWEREKATDTSTSVSTDFNAKSGFNLADPDAEFEFETLDDGWKPMPSGRSRDLPPPSTFCKPRVLNSSTTNSNIANSPVTGSNAANSRIESSSVYSVNTNAVSISISTGYDSFPTFSQSNWASDADVKPVAAESSYGTSSEDTRTDSVPSLDSLMRMSGEFSTTPATLPTKAEPEEAPDAVAPQIIPPPAKVLMAFSNSPLVFSEKEPEEPQSFDLKGEYFADKPDRSSKKSATGKRSTRKTNAKKGKKKR